MNTYIYIYNIFNYNISKIRPHLAKVIFCLTLVIRYIVENYIYICYLAFWNFTANYQFLNIWQDSDLTDKKVDENSAQKLI